MIAYRVNKKHWHRNPIEKIEVIRMTEKSYYFGNGIRRIDNEYRKVFTDINEAIDYAFGLANREIQELERQKKAALDRVEKILAFKDKAGGE